MSKKNKSAFDDLLSRLVIRCTNGSVNRAKMYLMRLYEMMLDELKVNGEFRVPKFGIFKVTHIEEKQIIGSDGEKKKYIYVPERYEISFSPSKYLIRSINEGEFTPVIDISPPSKEVKGKKPREKTMVNVTADLLQSALARQQKKGLE